MEKLKTFRSNPSDKSENSLCSLEISIKQLSEMSLIILSQNKSHHMKSKKIKERIRKLQEQELVRNNKTLGSERERLQKMQNLQEISLT